MAEQKYNIKSGFYDSINKDRLYSAEDMNRPYSRLINEGIFATKEGTPSTDFQVLSANDGMNIIVKKGEGMLAKKWIESPSDIVITVSNNTGIVPRKDSIIIQIDKRESGRIANVIYREGIASSNPIPPNLSADDDIVEMRVANIYVAAGTAKIEQVAISDLRGSEECLWITSLVKQVDTSELFRQWQTAYEEYYQKIIKALQDIEDGSAYLTKDRIEIITGECVVPAHMSSTKNLSYPSGFNSENCYIISCGIKKKEVLSYSYDRTSPQRSISLSNSSIQISLSNSDDNEVTFLFKMILMRI